MQVYLIVKGQIDPIENEVAPEIYKGNEWQKLDRIVRATIRMHLSESVYLIRHLYNLRMKDSDSVQAHLKECNHVTGDENRG